MWRSCFVLLVLSIVHAQRKESRMLPDYRNHECIRDCVNNGDPMICRYLFVAETYQTLSRACYNCAKGNITDCRRDHCVTANGFSRNIHTLNRGIPGPTIQVCQGDTVVIDVENNMALNEGLSIHWHGLLQKLTPHMDGVSMITQCPINTFTSFQYRFVAVDEGTHFYHAHTGVQRSEGIFGGFVVRQAPADEKHFSEYDFDLPEHVILLTEWSNKPMVEIFSSSHHSDGSQDGDAILINGFAHDSTGTLRLPRAAFRVQPNKRYRFRVISSSSLFCPITVSVDDHSLILIATDGKPFEAFEVDSFDIYSAERYDFILHTNHTNGTFSLRVTGIGSCNGMEEQALIRYITDTSLRFGHQVDDDDVFAEPPPRPKKRSGRLFNNWHAKGEAQVHDARSQVLAMNAMVEDDDSLLKEPDHQFLLDFDVGSVDNTHFFDPDLYPANQGPYNSVGSVQINKITNKLPPSPLLSQMNDIPEEQFCNSSTIEITTCETQFCECIHRLRVKKDEIVEMVAVSDTPFNGFIHPVHLHGFSFRVVAMNRLEDVMTPELFREMDARGEIPRKLHLAPFKDTLPLPSGGYWVIRFKADNPGVWYMHCHLALHVEVGMSLALEVLDENGELPAAPEGFPRCGNFIAPEETPVKKENSPAQVKRSESAPKNRLLGASNQGDNQKSSPPITTTVIPSWVLPVVLGLSIAIVGLVFSLFILWRKATRSTSLLRTEFPNYTTREEGVDNNHFHYSKRQEREVLTS